MRPYRLDFTVAQNTRQKAQKGTSTTAVEAVEADNTEESPVTETEAPRFSVERLLAEPVEITGYPVHEVAGALHGRDPAEELTQDEAKSAVADWLNTPVKEG